MAKRQESEQNLGNRPSGPGDSRGLGPGGSDLGNAGGTGGMMGTDSGGTDLGAGTDSGSATDREEMAENIREHMEGGEDR